MAYRMSLFLGAASTVVGLMPIEYPESLVHPYSRGPEIPPSASAGSHSKHSGHASETGSPYPTLSVAGGPGVIPPGVFGSGSASGASGVSGYPVGPTGIPHHHGPHTPTCLLPHVPDDHDGTDPAHIKPNTDQSLHYKSGDTTAKLDYVLHHPSVALQHVDEFTDLNCPADNEISFKLGSHYSEVSKTWPKSGEPLVLIDGSDMCGKPGQQTFFNVTSYKVDKNAKTFTGQGKAFGGADESLIKHFVINWQHTGSPDGSSPSATAENGPQMTAGPSYKNLAKRILGLPSPGDVFSDIKSEGQQAVSDVKQGASDIKSQAQGAASAVVSGAEGLKSDAQEALQKTEAVSKVITLNEQPTGTASSPWGPAKSLGNVDGVTIYCVKCGVTGELSLGGSIAVGFPDGIKEGAVDMSVKDLDVPMVFGFQAENAKSPNLPLKVQLFSAGLIPFEIPDVFVIGPMLTVDVSFNLQVSATGNLEAGLDFKLPDATAHMDLENKDTSASSNKGWTPEVEKTFNMTDGQLDVNGTFGVPISLGLGINILGGKFDRNVSITDTPSIELDTIMNTKGNQNSKRAYEDRNHARDLLISRDDDQCSNGIQEIIKLENDVVLNVADFWSTDLAPFTTQVFSTCINTGGSSGSASGGPAPTGGASGSAPASGAPANPTAPASGAPYPSSAPASGGSPPPSSAPVATPAPQ